jgi:hypothetical protein
MSKQSSTHTKTKSSGRGEESLQPFLDAMGRVRAHMLTLCEVCDQVRGANDLIHSFRTSMRKFVASSRSLVNRANHTAVVRLRLRQASDNSAASLHDLLLFVIHSLFVHLSLRRVHSSSSPVDILTGVGSRSPLRRSSLRRSTSNPPPSALCPSSSVVPSSTTTTSSTTSSSSSSSSTTTTTSSSSTTTSSSSCPSSVGSVSPPTTSVTPATVSNVPLSSASSESHDEPSSGGSGKGAAPRAGGFLMSQAPTQELADRARLVDAIDKVCVRVCVFFLSV